jgi:hypothetical protein
MKKDASEPLPTVGELVGYDPDMAQWEGDGEDVGVRSRMIITHSPDFTKPIRHKSTYMSPVSFAIQAGLIDWFK